MSLMNIGVSELIVVVLFMIAPAALIIWAIIDLLKRNFGNDTNKLIWALVIILVPFLGAIVYLVAGRKK